MGIRRQLERILAGLCSLLVLNIPFQTAALSDYGLTVSPDKCFLLTDNKKCEISVKLIWNVQIKGSYCLYRNDNETALQCWKQKQTGSLEYIVLSNSDVKFELRTSNDSQLIYRTELKLFKQVKRLKKRRRNPWSFY